MALKNKHKLIGLLGLLVIIAAAASILVLSPRSGQSANMATDTPIQSKPDATISSNTTPSVSPVTGSNTDTSIKTYNAEGSYYTPGGTETIKVTIALKSGIITDSNVVTSGDNPTGRMYQANFVANYKKYVTGRNISSLQLSVVSGSSLTPKGFNDAIEQIRNQAKT